MSDSAISDEHGQRRRPPVGSLLDHAARSERRRLAAWLLAGAVTTAGAYLVAPHRVPWIPGYFALALALWSLRANVGVQLARRDLRRADTPPRRAHVALLHDPAPRMVRPLLAVWDAPPRAGERLARPASVWRCDDELDELESHAEEPIVHEAWIDTGPRSWSKPRWVRADAGIALPHRRSLIGRWYVGMLLREHEPDAIHPLTIEEPQGLPGIDAELPLGGSLLRSVAGRVAVLALVFAVVALSV